MFLKEFAGGLPWAHLDIAGTAWAEEARPYLPKGPSGVAVRTLAELAFAMKRMRAQRLRSRAESPIATIFQASSAGSSGDGRG